MAAEKTDLVIIGAGWHGLITAKTYLEVNPSANVLILDKAATIGGVWAEHRLYPGLKTNNMLGTYEYSEFPMTGDNAFGIKPGEHIPGDVVHSYLERFAETQGILKLCRFSEDVHTARKLENAQGWILSVTNSARESYQITTQKLVVATGLTSEMFIPEFVGAKEFEAPIVHCGDLHQHSDKLLSTADNVVVFGGTKSAWDAAYAFAKKGIHVDWVIRESGHGPCWMSPPYVTPLKKWLEKLVTTRFLTWFSPCIWGESDGFKFPRWLLHRTVLGRAITRTFWWILGNDVISLNGYNNHPETAKLKPWIPAFWIAAGLSILNYPTDFFDLVREGRISVHIRDVATLSAKTVHFSSGESVSANALICSTGWKYRPAMSFLDTDGKRIDTDLGMPHHAEGEIAGVEKTDKEILSRFPILRKQPQLNPKLTSLPGSEEREYNRSFRLYRFMVPPALIHDHSIVFNGMIQTISTPIVAQAQALWLTAYLGKKMKVPEDAVVERETDLHTRFGKWRYAGGYGAKYPDFVFDAVPYVDMLLKDLDLNVHRKRGTISECFEPYGPSDYVGLVSEWKKKHE
ncbi:hypothetical protein FPQ18DRAFT_299496 [Pyronema domesticum]|nr:hypothetical protein FPQ18DRAFT_299496 [Pyronema domesticum]